MTFNELPFWMKIWILIVIVLVVAALVICVALGISGHLGGTDIDY